MNMHEADMGVIGEINQPQDRFLSIGTWYIWFWHTAKLLGIATMLGLIAMQLWPVSVEINLPTIQHVFVKR